MKYTQLAAQYLLGLLFVVFGLNYFIGFMAMPPQPEPALNFIKALGATGFIMPIVKVIEVAAGLMLLVNRFVPLALVLLAPIVIVIVLHNVILSQGGYPIVALLLAFNVILAHKYWPAFKGMITYKHPN